MAEKPEKVIEYGPPGTLPRRLLAGIIAVALVMGVLVGAFLSFGRPRQEAPQPANIPDPAAALDAMKMALAEQREEIAVLSRRLEALAREPEVSPPPVPAADRNLARLVAVMQLRARIENAQSHAAELAALQALSADDAGFSALIGQLAAELQNSHPDLDDLRRKFAALQHSPPGPSGDAPLGRRILSALTAPVSIRRIGEEAEGDSPEAVRARAEARLARGDLAGFLEEAGKLRDLPGLETILADVQKRNRVDEILNAMTARASEALAPAPGPLPQAESPGAI